MARLVTAEELLGLIAGVLDTDNIDRSAAEQGTSYTDAALALTGRVGAITSQADLLGPDHYPWAWQRLRALAGEQQPARAARQLVPPNPDAPQGDQP
jgi:hypothetical protein